MAAGCCPGRWPIPTPAEPLPFTRGPGTSTRVQIDHVVALGDAWQKGAQRWSAPTRAAFGNDPLNLLAVDGPTNESKGDGDAATWLPPDNGYRCAYVARQISVKTKYHLAVTAAERDAMRRVLARCPNQPLITPAAAVRNKAPRAAIDRPPTRTRRDRRTSCAETAGPRRSTPPAGPVYYQNCDAVRAAGKAPLLRGQPGYSRKLDRDGDGVACED